MLRAGALLVTPSTPPAEAPKRGLPSGLQKQMSIVRKPEDTPARGLWCPLRPGCGRSGKILRMKNISRLVVAVLVAAGQARADDVPALAQGSRVRISASSLGGPIRGTLAALRDESLTLQVSGKSDPVVIDRNRITRLEVSAGRRSRGRGAFIGAAVGFGAGLLMTAAIAAGGGDQKSRAYGAAYSLVLFTPMLSLTGALIGVAVPPGERWVKVSPQAGPGAGAPRPLGLRLVVRF